MKKRYILLFLAKIHCLFFREYAIIIQYFIYKVLYIYRKDKNAIKISCVAFGNHS